MQELTDSPLKFMYACGFANRIGTSPMEPGIRSYKK